jgi:hypothetical protein
MGCPSLANYGLPSGTSAQPEKGPISIVQSVSVAGSHAARTRPAGTSEPPTAWPHRLAAIENSKVTV